MVCIWVAAFLLLPLAITLGSGLYVGRDGWVDIDAPGSHGEWGGGRGARASCALHYWGKHVLSSGEPAIPPGPSACHVPRHTHAGNAVLPVRARPFPAVQVFPRRGGSGRASTVTCACARPAPLGRWAARAVFVSPSFSPGALIPVSLLSYGQALLYPLPTPGGPVEFLTCLLSPPSFQPHLYPSAPVLSHGHGGEKASKRLGLLQALGIPIPLPNHMSCDSLLLP